MWTYRGPDVRIPIHVWADELDDDTLAQAKNLARLPFAEHVALMADAHVGFGMPIGGVLATRAEILPYGVGGDIGCGMCAFATEIEAALLSPHDLATLRRAILERVPVGKESRSHADERLAAFRGTELFERIASSEASARGARVLDAKKIAGQIGTLGSGNHFLELQRDESGRLWVMVHSGSRNMGQQVVGHYHALAMKHLEREKVNAPKDLAWLLADSEDGADYLAKMQLALDYAKANRAAMVEAIRGALEAFCGESAVTELVDIHHNYAAREEHGGRELWVHRKGATQASPEVVGIIPGSMGTASFIVEGVGNADALQSCSHGAGRVLGRNEARRRLSLEKERAKLRGIVHGLDRDAALDEAPGAYKDIDRVMEAQRDLVRVRHRLKPIASMKG